MTASRVSLPSQGSFYFGNHCVDSYKQTLKSAQSRQGNQSLNMDFPTFLSSGLHRVGPHHAGSPFLPCTHACINTHIPRSIQFPQPIQQLNRVLGFLGRKPELGERRGGEGKEERQEPRDTHRHTNAETEILRVPKGTKTHPPHSSSVPGQNGGSGLSQASVLTALSVQSWAHVHSSPDGVALTRTKEA